MYYVKKQLIPENETYLLENKWIDEVVHDETSGLHHAHINTQERLPFLYIEREVYDRV